MGHDANHPYLELPVTVGEGAGSTTYYSDYYYQAAGQRVAVLGGRWDNGPSAGLSFWALNYSSGYASVIIGARLFRKGV